MAKLYFYYSAMNAGKSTVLLQSNYNYLERGMQTILYSPSIDTRYGVGKITSRLGINANAYAIDADFDLYTDIANKYNSTEKLACVLIDEAHFLEKQQVLQLCKVVDSINIPVLCYGLRSDFQGEPFPGSMYLLAWADNIEEIKTICHCGRKATHNMRVDDQGKKIMAGKQVFIGGNESYISTCRAHFYKGISGIIKAKDNVKQSSVV